MFPRLSPEWQARILSVLVEYVTIPDHAIRNGRRTVHLHEMTHEQRRQMMTEPSLPDAIRADLQLLVTIATLWGEEAIARFDFTPVPEVSDTSRIAVLLQPFRHRIGSMRCLYPDCADGLTSDENSPAGIVSSPPQSRRNPGVVPGLRTVASRTFIDRTAERRKPTCALPAEGGCYEGPTVRYATRGFPHR